MRLAVFVALCLMALPSGAAVPTQVQTCAGVTSGQAYAACTPVWLGVKNNADVILWCSSGQSAAGGLIAACTTKQWLKESNFQSYSWVFTTAGWQRFGDVTFTPVAPPPPPPPPALPAITSFVVSPTSGEVPVQVTLTWASTNTDTCLLGGFPGIMPTSGTWIATATDGSGVHGFSLTCRRGADFVSATTAIRTTQPPPKPYVHQCSKRDGVARADVPTSTSSRYTQLFVFDCTVSGTRFVEYQYGNGPLPTDLSFLNTPWGLDILTASEKTFGGQQVSAWIAAHP